MLIEVGSMVARNLNFPQGKKCVSNIFSLLYSMTSLSAVFDAVMFEISLEFIKHNNLYNLDDCEKLKNQKLLC
jgi:hypothetical protein